MGLTSRMHDWERHDDHLVIELDPREAVLLRNMVTQISEVLRQRVAETPQDELAELTGIRTGASTPPDNRILARLLPDFHRADQEPHPDQGAVDLAGALRSVHEPDLIAYKTGTAEQVLRTCPIDGGEIHLTNDEAESWLTAINDVRLALGAVLNLTEDGEDEKLSPEDPNAAFRGVYEWFTHLQDSLVQVLFTGVGSDVHPEQR